MPTIHYPFTVRQIGNVHDFLADRPEGKGYFGNFVLRNANRDSYSTLDWDAAEVGHSDKERLFDVYKLLFLSHRGFVRMRQGRHFRTSGTTRTSGKSE